MIAKFVHGIIRRNISSSPTRLNAGAIRGLKFVRASEMGPKHAAQDSVLSRAWKVVDSTLVTGTHSSRRSNSTPPGRTPVPSLLEKLREMSIVNNEVPCQPKIRFNFSKKRKTKCEIVKINREQSRKTMFMKQLMQSDNVRTPSTVVVSGSPSNQKFMQMTSGNSCKLRNFSLSVMQTKEAVVNTSAEAKEQISFESPLRLALKTSARTAAYVDDLQKIKRAFSSQSKRLEKRIPSHTNSDLKKIVNNTESLGLDCSSAIRKPSLEQKKHDHEIHSFKLSTDEKSNVKPTQSSKVESKRIKTKATRDYGAISASQRLGAEADHLG